MSTDYNSMSEEELKTVLKEAGKALDTLEERRRADALRAAESAAKEFGYTLTTLLKQPGKRVATPKYRDPQDPSITWSGLGRKPQWMKDAQERGVTEEEMLIG